jgi:hypothetical protein
MQTTYPLYALMLLTAVPIFVDVVRPWLVPYLVMYSLAALAVAIGSEKKKAPSKKTDDPLVEGGKATVGSMFDGVKVMV